MGNTFTRKGYGRIYVDRVENIKSVEEIIKAMDEFEYEYLPKDFIAPYTEYPKVVYTHKFDSLDLNKLTARCWEASIHIWTMQSGFNEYPEK